MKYTEFLHTIETEITARLDNNFKLTIHPVKKNNGMIYDGLVIINPKFNIAPTIYLNPYYHWYLDGVSIDSILDAILSTYNDFKPTEDFDISFCDDFSRVKEKIIFQLISYDKNQKQLKDVPYIKYLDFAIIFEVYVGAQLPEFGTITVTDALLSRWGIDTWQSFLPKNVRAMPIRCAQSVILTACLCISLQTAGRQTVHPPYSTRVC